MIPLVDLKAQYKSIKNEIDQAISRVIEESVFVGGTEIALLEKEFAAFCGVNYAVGVANGTEALYLAIRALGIGRNDEIITVPHTFIATTEAITLNQAKPVFVDIDANYYSIDPAKIEAKITKNTKAIIPVHIYGQLADMDSISEIAKKYKLCVIEDAAQAHGASHKGRRAGALGDIACFSFFPGKNIGAFGDGGMVVTDNQELADRVRKIKDHGRLSKYEHDEEGVNSRLDNLQAAILRVKLKYLERWNQQRRGHAELYNRLLQNTADLVLPAEMPGSNSVFHLYVIQTEQRDKLKEYLAGKGIATGIHYPLPLHLQKAYGYLQLKKGDYPVVEKMAKRILSLPMYPELTSEQVEFIARSVKEFYQ